MSLRDDLEWNLKQLHASGAAMPASLTLHDSTGLSLRIELTRVDSIACAFTELEMFVPALQSAPFQVLEQWAAEVSNRVTYLLEKIGPLEFDPQQGQVLIRSTPPAPRPAGTQYYEIRLTTSGNGSLTLRRFQFQSGQPGRMAVEIQLTHELLFQLVEDLLDTIPTVP